MIGDTQFSNYSLAMLTTQEVDFYIRATLKQHGISNVKYSFKDMHRTLGYYHVQANEIVLSLISLRSFALFHEVLLHEIAHALDAKEKGGTLRVNGRNDFHGKNWKKYCAQLKIPARRFIPA